MAARPVNRDPFAVLMPSALAADTPYQVLPLRDIDPNPAQSRQVFDPDALAELAASIAAHGVLEPILVRPVGARYQVVAGERRTRAARIAGLTDIPAIVHQDMSDQDAALITALENLQRQDLDIEDEARWLERLQTLTGESARDLAKRLGKNQNYVAERLRVVRRPDLMAQYRAGDLTWKQVVKQASEPPPTPELSAGISPAEDSTTVGPTRRAVERAEIDRPVLESGQYFRWVDTAMKALDKIRPMIIAPSERPIWAEQLAALEERVRELRASLED
jgi:ParB/RepB/Spo0J family partition protein